MERLSAVLERWKPLQASVEHAIVVHWERVVGPWIAANTRPRELHDGTLTVVVSSATWRHELSLRAPGIVKDLQALKDVGMLVQRLRLRQGRAQAPGRPRDMQLGARPRGQTHGEGRRDEPAADTRTALIRLRERFVRIAEQERRAGREPCPSCGAFSVRGTSCRPCARRRQHAIERAVQRHFFEAPQLDYDGMAALVPGLDFTTFKRARAQLLERWWQMLQRARLHKTVSRDGRERKVAMSYAVLKSGIAPERLSEVQLREALPGHVYDLLWGVHDTR